MPTPDQHHGYHTGPAEAVECTTQDVDADGRRAWAALQRFADGLRDTGLAPLAAELRERLEELAPVLDDLLRRSVDRDFVIPALREARQELSALEATSESRISALEARIDELLGGSALDDPAGESLDGEDEHPPPSQPTGALAEAIDRDRRRRRVRLVVRGEDMARLIGLDPSGDELRYVEWSVDRQELDAYCIIAHAPPLPDGAEAPRARVDIEDDEDSGLPVALWMAPQ